MTQQDVLKLIEQLTGNQRTAALPLAFVKMLKGDVAAAYLLSQLIYWSSRTTAPGGWIRKSYSQWLQEIGLSQYQVSRAVKVLKPLGVQAQKRQFNRAPVMHYRIDFAVFEPYLRNSIMKDLDNQESQQCDYEESQQCDYEDSSQSYISTKSTTESTPKSIELIAAPSGGDENPPIPEQPESAPATPARPRNELFDSIVEEGFGIDPADRAGVTVIAKQAGWFSSWAAGNAVKAGPKSTEMIPGADPVWTPSEMRGFLRWYRQKGIDFPNTITAFVKFAGQYRKLNAPPPPPKMHHIPDGWLEPEERAARMKAYYERPETQAHIAQIVAARTGAAS